MGTGLLTFVYLVVVIVISCVFGAVTQSIIDKKGYYENWFWWGFFFGWIAIVVAALKSENTAGYYSQSAPKWMESGQTPVISQNEELLKKGGWKCKCGRINPSYTGTCACGTRKNDVLRPSPKPKETKSADKFEEIKKYKDLLDSGIITEEEFAKKKKELLDI